MFLKLADKNGSHHINLAHVEYVNWPAKAGDPTFIRFTSGESTHLALAEDDFDRLRAHIHSYPNFPVMARNPSQERPYREIPQEKPLHSS